MTRAPRKIACSRCRFHFLAILAATLLSATPPPALAQCATIASPETGGCRLTAPSQTLTIQSGGALNGWLNMTGLAPGAALTVDSGGTLRGINGAPSLNGGGQVTNVIVGLAGANQTITNNGTITINQTVAVDLIGVYGSGFTITNNGQIINNDPHAVSNAIAVETANVSGTINNHGSITAAGAGIEGTIYVAAGGGTLAINNFQGATIHSDPFIAVNVPVNETMILRNAGTISTNSSTAPAIRFGVASDTLILEPTSVIRGFVDAGGGINKFALGGTTNGGFDVSGIGAAAQYRNFQAFEKIDANTWALTGTTTASTPWTVTQGTLQISADNNLGAAGTTLTLNGGTLATTATFNSSRPVAITANNGGVDVADGTTLTWNGAISGPGALSKFGAGTLLFNGNQSYAGATNVLAGALAIGDPSHASANLSGSSLVTVASGATLGGYGTVAGNVVNNGTIAAANAVSAFSSGPTGTFTIGGNVTNSGLINLAGSTPGNVLKIGGNYIGTAGSSVQFNTVLNAGGPLSNQFTDRLLITGSADPSTVTVRASGSGAFTSTGLPTNTSGISLIQVAGSSNPGAFSLAGGYITGGTPFQYRLNAYGPGSSFGPASPGQNLVGNSGGYWDFRLQNAFVTPSGDPATPGSGPVRPALAPQVPAYISAPTALFNAGLLDIDQLHRRLGEIRDAQAVGLPKTVEVFARAYGNTMTYKSNRSFTDYGIDATESYAAIQAGASGIVRDDDLGMLRLGLAFSYGHLQFDPDAPEGFSEGSFNSEKLSAIATYQAHAGWYLDGIVTGGWFNGAINTSARGQASSLNGSLVGASLEGGYPIGLGWQKLSVEPQVQVSWQHLMFDPMTDVDSINVQLGTLDQGVVRAGARLVRPFETDDKRFVTPYVKVNLLQGFADGGAINVGGVNFDTGQYGTAIQMGGGVTGMLTASLAVYGDVSYQHEVSDGGFRGWAFNGGVRYSF